MQNITSAIGLKDAILLLETDKRVKEMLLKEQFRLTYETIKPFNLIKHTLKDISSSPYLIDNILGTTVGIATGFLSNKLFVGASVNIIRKIVGSALQFGVTNVVAKHPDSVKSLGQTLLKFFHRKKDTKSLMP